MNFRQVHLDFHTSEKIPGIGAKFSKKQFQEALIAGHVNSITVFSKCHHGWAYHPSKKNEMHPGLNFDLLKAEIEAAHEIGVKTPVYLSAGLDEKMALRHPEWLVRDKESRIACTPDFMQPGYHKFCLNSPYLDYLLEQIKEVCENYDADGIFLDIVGVQPCYCGYCLRQLEREGKDRTNPKDILELAERVYRSYMQRVRDTVDSVKPGLPVFHNAGNVKEGRRDLGELDTHYEVESLPTGGWGYDHFPLAARFVQQLGKDFLGMTGKFHHSWGEFGGFKHPNALRYEVSLSAANGAKCSIGDQLHPNGEMDMATYKLIGTAYREIEEKEQWLDNVTAKSDVGVFTYTAYMNEFHREDEFTSFRTDVGAARILLENKILFDIIDMQSDFSRYKVIILPDVVRICDTLKKKLDEFIAGGGKILATGKAGLYEDKDKFVYDLGAEYIGECKFRPTYCRPDFEMEGLFESAYLFQSICEDVKVKAGSKEFASHENPYFNRTYEHFCSHQHAPTDGAYAGAGMTMGKDGIYVAWQTFTDYADNGSLIAKRVIAHALDVLLEGRKTIETNLGAQGVVTVMEQKDNNRFINHLLYAPTVKRGKSTEIIEDIPDTYNTNVLLRLDRDIKKVTLVPQNIQIEFTKNNGEISFTVEKFNCHQMICLEY